MSRTIYLGVVRYSTTKTKRMQNRATKSRDNEAEFNAKKGEQYYL